MSAWPLQNVVLFSAPYERVYIAPRASAGYCVWVTYAAGLLFCSLPELASSIIVMT